MKPISEQIKQKPWLGWAIFFATMLFTFLLGLLASSIMERRTEAMFAYSPKVKISPFESNNAKWGENYPREYQSYLLTADTGFRSKYNGSATIDMLGVDPRMVVLWAGYAFSKEYKQGRGHYYAITDITETLRTGAPMKPGEGPQPATCWTCKSPDVPRLMNKMGVEEFYHQKWSSLGKEVINPIGCADCHDPQTMNLQITRPALIEAFQRSRKDITKVSHQEMRSLVCAQCHVEYYFKGEGKYLTFPWDSGYTADAIEKYYDNAGFSDWKHALSQTPMLKAQHPDYELFATGIHAQRGVACADCHMPYKSEGGQKFTDHHIQSPLNNISNSCQVCHRQSEAELLKNVYERQDKIMASREQLEKLLLRAHNEAKVAWEKGAKEEIMNPILQDIRHAQWRWDFTAASHGASFHSPIEVSRILASGFDISGEARVKLARVLASLDHNQEIPYPDIDTKEKAQKYIGLDMAKLNKEKAEFIKQVVPEWTNK
jgi:nitrite reductase (cytochrome c-552)